LTGLLFFSVYDFYKRTDYVDVAEVFAAANDVTDVRIIGLASNITLLLK
jgi:hypothetical protein